MVLADGQGMPIQVNGGVLCNGHLANVLARLNITGQCILTTSCESISIDRTRQISGGHKRNRICREMLRHHSHVAGFGFLRLHVGDFLGLRINMVDLWIKSFRIQSAEGHGDGAYRLDLLLAVPQGNVQQEALLRLGVFLRRKLLPDGLALFLRHLCRSQRDLTGREGQGGAVAGNGHGDAGSGLGRQGECLRLLRQAAIVAEDRGIL